MQFDPNGFYGERGEAHVEVVDPGTGLGGYVRVPYTHYWGTAMYDASASAFGDIDLGGVLRVRTSYDIDIVLHAGFTLPTAPQSENEPNVFTSLARCEDLALALPDATSIRIGASPMWRSGHFVARADLGIDFNLSNHYETAQFGAIESYDIGWIAHLDAGVGYVDQAFALMVELTSIRVDGEFPVSEMLPGTPYGRFVSAALSMRFGFGKVEPYVALLVPLQGSIEYNRLGFGATAGVDVALF